MNVIALSAHAWSNHRAQAMQLLQRLAQSRTHVTAVIDRAAVERERIEGSALQQPLSVFEQPFSGWVTVGMAEGGVLDMHTIRNAASQIPGDHIVIVDASSHRPALVTAALGHLRHAWFHLDTWHPAFVVVFDDVHLLALADALSQTFYCQPQLLTEVETNRLVRQMVRRALIYRWFGPGLARRHEGLLFRYVDRFARWKDRRAERLEYKG